MRRVGATRRKTGAAASIARLGGGLGLAFPASGATLSAGFARAIAHEMDDRRLFAWSPVIFGAGAILYFSADVEPSPWAAPVFATLAALAAWRVAQGWARRVLVGLVVLLLGFAAADLRVAMVAAPTLQRLIIAEANGYVVSVDHRAEGARLLIRPTRIAGLAPAETPGLVRVVSRRPVNVAAGDFVAARMRLSPPPGPVAPGGYDFARDAWFRGIGAVGSLLDPPRRVAAQGPVSWREALVAANDRARNALTARIAGVIGGQAGAVAAALVTGKRDLITEETNAVLRGAGIYHVVSISGLHMVLAAGVFFWSLRALLALSPALATRRPIKKWAAAGAMFGACAYALFSGAEVATQRSLVMTLTMLGAILVDRPAISLRNLAIAALIVIALSPEAVLGPSFQMSFAAVAAMIASHGWAARVADSRAPGADGPVLRALRKAAFAVLLLITTTLVAGLATAPYAAFHFNRVNPYGLIGNALALPVVSFIVMPAAVAGAVLHPLGLDGPVWRLMGAGVEAMNAAAAWVASFEGASRPVAAFGSDALIVLSLALLFLCLWRGWALRAVAAPLAALGLVLAAGHPRPDILVDRDARAVAVRGGDGRLTLMGVGLSRFALERWLAADGDGRDPADPGLWGAARCDPLGCVARLPDGRAVALTRDPAALFDDCRRAYALITPLQAPPGCAAPLILDRAARRDLGATAVRIIPGAPATIIGARTAATRPWGAVAKRAPANAPETLAETPRLAPSDALDEGALLD